MHENWATIFCTLGTCFMFTASILKYNILSTSLIVPARNPCGLVTRVDSSLLLLSSIKFIRLANPSVLCEVHCKTSQYNLQFNRNFLYFDILMIDVPANAYSSKHGFAF